MNLKHKDFVKSWEASFEEIPDGDISKSWEEFHVNYIMSKKDKRSFSNLYIVAAMLLLLLSGYIFINNYNNPSEIIVENLTSNTKEIFLPDGTAVILSSGSKITYSKNFKQMQIVDLKGEALFKSLNKKTKLTVQTLRASANFEGNSFLVREDSIKNRMDIFLYSGKIVVSVNELNRKWILKKGDQFLFTSKHIGVKTFDQNFHFGNQEFVDLNQISLDKIFAYLQNHFGYQIKYNSDLGERKMTFRINKSDSITQLIKLMSIINKFEYEIDSQNHTIIIK